MREEDMRSNKEEPGKQKKTKAMSVTLLFIVAIQDLSETQRGET